MFLHWKNVLGTDIAAAAAAATGAAADGTGRKVIHRAEVESTVLMLESPVNRCIPEWNKLSVLLINTLPLLC